MNSEKAGYFLLRALTWFVHLIPLRVHYFISDIIVFFAYSVFRYRRDVVEINLANSFPGKSKRERDRIARSFYLHLCDSAIETLYFDRISVSEGKKCVRYVNYELPNSYLDQGRDVVVFLGHYNNWEWFANWPLYSEHRFYPIYKKLTNQAFNKFYHHLRSRFGAVPLERGETFRQLISDHQKKIPTISAFLFDQTPRVFDIQHWVTFLNQDTPVILGAEKIAQKLDAVVLFAHTRKLKRGEYEVEYLLVSAHAANCSKYEITEKCTSLLEQQIVNKPDFWLWSHRRWKHTRPVSMHVQNN